MDSDGGWKDSAPDNAIPYGVERKRPRLLAAFPSIYPARGALGAGLLEHVGERALRPNGLPVAPRARAEPDRPQDLVELPVVAAVARRGELHGEHVPRRVDVELGHELRALDLRRH